MDVVSKDSSLWFTFLQVRANLIDQWHGEGRTDTQIATQLSMDTEQVRLIRGRLRVFPYNGTVYLTTNPAREDEP